MQEDNIFPAAERIISDIASAFKKDPKLKEFDIVSVTLNENKSPVIVEDHCLGLESWCVRHVYCHAYSRIMEARIQKRRREDPERISSLLTVALLINPDVSTMWNIRRELVEASLLDLRSELHFSAVVLTRKPKSGEVFAYRRWLIKKVLLEEYPSNASVLSEELLVSELAAERYPNNYHAWNHRMWCLAELLSTANDKVADWLTSEWSRSRSWVATHVSDYSGFQYRQQLLTRILAADVKLVQTDTDKVLRMFFKSTPSGDAGDKNDSISSLTLDPVSKSALSLLCSELSYIAELISLFPGHEAIWCHRRFVLYAFCNRFLNSTERKDSVRRVYRAADGSPLEKELKTESVTMETLRSRLIALEKSLCACCRDDCQQSKAASKHRVWMENVLKIKFS